MRACRQLDDGLRDLALAEVGQRGEQRQFRIGRGRGPTQDRDRVEERSVVARDDHLDREPTEEVGEQVRVAAACGEVERLDGALVITPPARRARAEPARVSPRYSG